MRYYFTTLSVLVFCCALLIVASADGIERVGLKRERPVRNTLQACRKEYRSLCAPSALPSTGPVAPRSRRAPVECLTSKVDEIKDATCKAWVVAEQSCRDAAKKQAECSKGIDLRRCFRAISPDALPESCTSSDFYKSFIGKKKRSKAVDPKSS